MERLDFDTCVIVKWFIKGQPHLIPRLITRAFKVEHLELYGAKLYLMDDGRWLIMDYLNIPDAPRHYIDCIEGSVCNMNVRIISEGTKVEIEKNQEMFNELT